MKSSQHVFDDLDELDGRLVGPSTINGPQRFRECIMRHIRKSIVDEVEDTKINQRPVPSLLLLMILIFCKHRWTTSLGKGGREHKVLLQRIQVGLGDFGVMGTLLCGMGWRANGI